jgi:nucleotide-binding universal stress UspA family protein
VYTKILVPLDGGEVAQLGLHQAIELARRLGSRIRLLHIINDLPLIPPEVTGATFDQLFERVRDDGLSLLKQAQTTVRAAGIEVDTELLDAGGTSVGEGIVREAVAWQADLIVCGTHGRRGIRRLVMGSDAEHVLRESPVPVLLVRARR